MNAVVERAGFVQGLSNEDYHADRTAVSASALKEMLKSPAHYHAYLNGVRKETASKDLGKAIHYAILEPDLFQQKYVVQPKFNRRSNAGKAAAEEFESQHPGKEFLTQDEYDIVQRAKESVHAHRTARELLALGVAEQSYFWTEPRTGIKCKSRPDWLHPAALVDLKSAVDASRSGFGAACARLHYDMSAYMGRLAIKVSTGRDLPFVFIAVEKEEPFCSAVYIANEAMLHNGRMKFERAMDMLKHCRAMNRWPGYQADGRAEEIELPRWSLIKSNPPVALLNRK